MCTKGMNLALKVPGYGELMLQYIEWARTEGRYPGVRMAAIGLACLTLPPLPLKPAAKAAWRAGLELMRSQRGPPDMDLYAWVRHPDKNLMTLTDRAF